MKYLAVLLVIVVLFSGLIVLNTIYPVLPGVANITGRAGQAIADNWRGFLFNKEVAPSPSDELLADDLLAAQIKVEVDKAVAARLAGVTVESDGSVNGLIVMPANQTSTSIGSIAESFSDEVEVHPDASGNSGVIIPIFRNGPGAPYLYILTPIKQ